MKVTEARAVVRVGRPQDEPCRETDEAAGKATVEFITACWSEP